MQIRTMTINGAAVHECPRALLEAAKLVLEEQISHASRVARQPCPRAAACANPPCTDFPTCDAPREVRRCRGI